MTRPGRENPDLFVLVRTMWRIAYGWRIEALLATAVGVVDAVALRHLGSAAVIYIALVVFFLLPRQTWLRKLVLPRLANSASWRLWARIAQHCGVGGPLGALPKVLRQEFSSTGETLTVQVPIGVAPKDFEARAEVLAAGLGAREVRVKRNAETASVVDLVVVSRDPLLDPEPLAWPNRDAERLSLWEPVPVALDEDGEAVNISLAERNVLLGGEPGAGKSVALSLLAATAALDPKVDIYLLDGKLVELACWERVASGFAGPKVADAVKLLTTLQEEMDRRYQVLRANRRRKVEPGMGMPIILVICDELAHYLTASDRKARGEFSDLLRDLVSRGRAAGVIVVAATQKPSGDIVPTALRDLFSFRWALRCSTWQASDTVLGAGWATLGFSASSIPPEGRGIGFLLHEGGIPGRCKAFHLSDDELLTLADRAEQLRKRETTWPR